MAGSLRSSAHTEGGSGFGEGIQRVPKGGARFVRHDLGGKSPMKLFLAIAQVSPDGKERTQYWSAGDLSMFVPSADGKSYEPVPGAVMKNGKPAPQTLYKNSNASRLLASLEKANFPIERLDAGDISVIEEGEYLFETQTLPPAKFNGETKEQKVLLITKVVKLPGGASAAATPTGKAVNAVKTVLAANAGRIESAKLSGEIFKTLLTDPERNAVISTVTPAFLAQPGQPWIYDAQAGLVIGQ